MRIKTFRRFMCDFETTVFEGQEYTEVWAAALVEIGTEDVQIFHSINEFFKYIFRLDEHVMLYFHNLKFDGFFILSYLMSELHWTEAITEESEGLDIEWKPEYKMQNKTFKYMISEMGAFYTIIMKYKGHYIEIRDSLKLLPFSVKEIGKAFETKHKKLNIVYKGFRYAGCEITEKEREYIANDVLVVKEALEILFSEGHDKMTIGACCMKEFKSGIGRKQYETWFPDLTEFPLNPEIYGARNADEYIRRSYKGGWCYLKKKKENKIYKDGLTFDVNSLYPSMMSGESGNVYPVGKPLFWSGDFIPEEALLKKNYFFVRIRTRFFLKEHHLPTIQIKNNWLYRSTEWLETSDIFYNGEYFSSYRDLDGEIKPALVTMTLTQTDYALLKDHYYLEDFEILDGCYFKTAFGLFDDYINKYKKIKMESKGAKRTLAKLFLNNLYGKMATSKNSSFKFCVLREDDSIGFLPVEEYNKKVVYIPIGSAITSYARNFTIRAAQLNYYGKDKPGFIYADTDSIHLDLKAEDVRGLRLDSKAFQCWDLENEWKNGLFVRQKTYIEWGNNEYNIKCAGMPDRCKQLFISTITGEYDNLKEYEPLSEAEKEFLNSKHTPADFKRGLKVPGKLLPKRIPGGIVLVDTTYEMR